MSRLMRLRLASRIAAFLPVIIVAPACGMFSLLCFSQVSSNDLSARAPEKSAGALTPTVSANREQPAGTIPSAVSSALSPDRLRAAAALYRKGEYDGAVRSYEDLRREPATFAEASAGLARVYLNQRKIDEAARSIAQAMATMDTPCLHVVRGEVLFRQGRITEAEKEWVDVINAGHSDARAYLGLARVHDSVAMHRSAKTMIDKARALDAEDPDIQRYWIRTLQRADRIKYYEAYLAGDNNLGGEERTELQNYLSYLKEPATQPGSCHLVGKVTATQTPLARLLMDPTHLRGYGLSVALNGTKTKMMLDTGASGIVVNRRVAARAGITKLTETRIWGVGDKGAKNAYLGTANTIRIGELEFHDCPVEVVESRSVAEEEGLIGADVFEKFLVEIDFPNEKLKLKELPRRPGQQEETLALDNSEDGGDDSSVPAWSDAKHTGTDSPAQEQLSGPQDRYIAPEMQPFTRIFRFGHDLLIPTRIGDAPSKLFLLDTGALNNAISPQAAREVTKLQGDSDTIVKGLSGSVKEVYSANKAVIQFGHLKQENQDMLAFDTSAISNGNGTEVSGFLGFAMLRFLDIKIDYRDALVEFSYDARRFGR